MGQGSRLIRPRTVTGDGDGLVSHAGIAWLAETADLSGLGAGLSAAMAGVPQRRHDAGRTLAQMVLGLADGATCLSDLAARRENFAGRPTQAPSVGWPQSGASDLSGE